MASEVIEVIHVRGVHGAAYPADEYAFRVSQQGVLTIVVDQQDFPDDSPLEPGAIVHIYGPCGWYDVGSAQMHTDSPMIPTGIAQRRGWR